jgi:hypothetical protein
LTPEEDDNLEAERRKSQAVCKAADEEGGPRLTLVAPDKRGEVWPTDLLPASDKAMPFDGVVLEDSRKRLAGWNAERQRMLLVNLAETGSVHLASAAARLSARSAYRLRARSPAFAAAWDTEDQLAVGRLSAIAFDRATAPSRCGRKANWSRRSACRATGCRCGCSPGSTRAASPPRGSCARAARPIRKQRRGRASRRCSTGLADTVAE